MPLGVGAARIVPLNRVRLHPAFARQGEIPGVLRAANGYHLAYPDTPELRLWCKQKRRIAKERAQGRPTPIRWYSARRDVDLQLPQKLAVAFHEWNSWMDENLPFQSWDVAKLHALRVALTGFQCTYEAVAKLVKAHEQMDSRTWKPHAGREKEWKASLGLGLPPQQGKATPTLPTPNAANQAPDLPRLDAISD